MKSMRSITTRIITNFLIVIIMTIVILNIMLYGFVKKYFYDNTEDILRNQLQFAVSYYDKYYAPESDYSNKILIESLYENVDIFIDQTPAQVQVFDDKANLIMDSIGMKDANLKNMDDIKKAFNGSVSRWVGKSTYSEENIMAVSMPINVNDNTIGVVRFICSLENTDDAINQIVFYFFGISMGVLGIGIILSIVMGKSISNPIRKLNSVAENMAKGDLTVRNDSRRRDEVGQLARTIDFMAQEILEREELKDKFISSVSHELRTPLTAIKGWAITLNEDKGDIETLETGLNIIEKETDRLTSMVEELLDFSRFINGTVILKPKYTKLGELAEFIRLSMEPRAEREGKVFKVNCNGFEEEVLLDIDKMKQVLLNLLDNSFKFTEVGGSIIVEVETHDKYITICVKDDGAGISVEDLPRVKERFYKGKNVNSKNGIGLSICDEIIKLHKGEFDIESTEGKGTTIKIKIPKGEGI